ncbi:coiled-coil domain-containing protein [Enterococcus raffinosus]|uniref:hypothetical protein n=1 Tax=Enterococcus raffinosus TaxID=71452 RepID=UPI001C97F632|nr:hypothetical protein [Enterococcus raffinosus]QZO09261.1 hypothetical protein K5P74_01755 [Enterococcus raffinosus]
MRLNQLDLEYNGIKKTFNLDSRTLIHSAKNSAGKSTLLRLLFYSMGYSIPQTKRLPFKKVKTRLSLKTPMGLEFVERTNDKIVLIYEDDSSLEYNLPTDEGLVISAIWNTKNENVLKSILGSIYMDQEKGWTLLNRGTVIGSIKFKVEDLIEGVSERDLSEQKTELENINAEIKKYSQILNIIEYKNHLSQLNNDSIFSSDYVSELESKLQLKKIRSEELKAKISDLEDSLKENKQFINYIEKMDLVVKDKDSGIEIPVKEDTIIHFNDNQKYINARVSLLKREQSYVEKDIREIMLEIQKSNNLFSLQSEIDKADNLISQVSVPYEQLIQTLDSLRKKKKSLTNEMKEKLSVSNKTLNNLHFSIMKYATKLGVDQYIDQSKNYIFTSDLKSLSGAILHKIVFSFKMAYIIELQNYLGYKLPVVLDSPSGREVDQKNVEETFDILNEDFKDNQIIVASIYKYNNFKPSETIELIDKIFSEESITLDDIEIKTDHLM